MFFSKYGNDSSYSQQARCEGYEMHEYYSTDMPDDYTVVDTETTGLFAHDRIIEIAAIRVRNRKVVASFERLVNPGMTISPGASKVNGITNSMVRKCPPFSEIKDEFLAFIGNDILVGHNFRFDLKFINRELRYGLSNRFIDTLRLARTYVDDIDNHKLSTLVKHFGIKKVQQHRALGDVELTHVVFEEIKDLMIESTFLDAEDSLPFMDLKEVVTLLQGFDSILKTYDQKIIAYLKGEIRYKKTVTEEAPKIPQNIESSIYKIYRKDHLLDDEQFHRLLSIARKRLVEYKLRENLVMRVDAKTKTLKDPFNAWQEDHRDLAYEQRIMAQSS